MSPNTYLLTEVAPLSSGFGKGPGGVNWPANITGPHIRQIVTQMYLAIMTANEEGVPVIDVFNASKEKDMEYVDPKYINTHDGIHPSAEGHTLTADIITFGIKID